MEGGGTSVNRDHASVIRVQRVWSELSWEGQDRETVGIRARQGQDECDQDWQLRGQRLRSRYWPKAGTAGVGLNIVDIIVSAALALAY